VDCEKLKTCIFFNDQMDEMPNLSAVLKTQYCRGAFEDCARFRIASRFGGPAVPRDLYPTDKVRADALLAAAR